MKQIKFNYRPKIATEFIDNLVAKSKNDPEATDEMRKVYEDVRTLVHLGFGILQPAPGGTGDNKKS